MGPSQDQLEPRRQGDHTRLGPLHEHRPRRDYRVHKGQEKTLRITRNQRGIAKQVYISDYRSSI